MGAPLKVTGCLPIVLLILRRALLLCRRRKREQGRTLQGARGEITLAGGGGFCSAVHFYLSMWENKLDIPTVETKVTYNYVITSVFVFRPSVTPNFLSQCAHLVSFPDNFT